MNLFGRTKNAQNKLDIMDEMRESIEIEKIRN